jgi:hypothetical protein
MGMNMGMAGTTEMLVNPASRVVVLGRALRVAAGSSPQVWQHRRQW